MKITNADAKKKGAVISIGSVVGITVVDAEAFILEAQAEIDKLAERWDYAEIHARTATEDITVSYGDMEDMLATRECVIDDLMAYDGFGTVASAVGISEKEFAATAAAELVDLASRWGSATVVAETEFEDITIRKTADGYHVVRETKL